MKEINYRAIEKMPITIEVMNMISVLHEYKGRQELYIETQPKILDKLMEVAKIRKLPIRLKGFIHLIKD